MYHRRGYTTGSICLFAYSCAICTLKSHTGNAEIRAHIYFMENVLLLIFNVFFFFIQSTGYGEKAITRYNLDDKCLPKLMSVIIVAFIVSVNIPYELIFHIVL